jgi:nucleotide-binding universal stress UspA family protein
VNAPPRDERNGTGGSGVEASPDLHAVFSRVVCGVDGSSMAMEAAWQAAVLAPADAELLLVAAFDGDAEDQLRFVRDKLGQAQEDIAPIHTVTTRVVPGHAGKVLLAEITQQRATLLALGIFYRSRTESILGGGVAASLLHRAPCSVLIAREPTQRDGFPRAVVVGLDGSQAGFTALAAARELCSRLGCELRALVATDDHHANLDAVRDHLAGDRSIPLVVDGRNPVEALSGCDADLVVIGSRGAHGLRALGSVSERVAHQGLSSVLVIR